MAEEKQPLVIELGRGYNGFYCPESNFHLIGGVKPQAVYPAKVLTEDVKRGLRSGTLIDTNRILSTDDIKAGKGFSAHVTSGDRKKEIAVKAEEKLKAEKEEEKSEEEKLANETGEFLSENDVATNTGKVLFAYIEKTEGISLESLELTKGSTVAEVRAALNKHFGYSVSKVTQED